MFPYLLSIGQNNYLDNYPFIYLGQMLFSNFEYDKVFIKEPRVQDCAVTFHVVYEGSQIKSNVNPSSKGVVNNFIQAHLKGEMEKMNFRQYKNKTKGLL